MPQFKPQIFRKKKTLKKHARIFSPFLLKSNPSNDENDDSEVIPATPPSLRESAKLRRSQKRKLRFLKERNEDKDVICGSPTSLNERSLRKRLEARKSLYNANLFQSVVDAHETALINATQLNQMERTQSQGPSEFNSFTKINVTLQTDEEEKKLQYGEDRVRKIYSRQSLANVVQKNQEKARVESHHYRNFMYLDRGRSVRKDKTLPEPSPGNFITPAEMLTQQEKPESPPEPPPIASTSKVLDTMTEITKFHNLDDEEEIFHEITTQDPHQGFNSPEPKKFKPDKSVENSPDILGRSSEESVLSDLAFSIEVKPEVTHQPVEFNKILLMEAEEENLGTSPGLTTNISVLSLSFEEIEDDFSQKSISEGKINAPLWNERKKKPFVDVDLLKRSLSGLSQRQEPVPGHSRWIDDCDFASSPTSANRKRTAPKRLFMETLDSVPRSPSPVHHPTPPPAQLEERNDVPAHEMENQENPSAFEGFKMASMKKVKFSEQTLKRVQNIFGDLGEITPSSAQFEERNDVPVFQMENQENPPAFEGFQMASRKKVKFSEQTLKRVQNIFEDLGKITSPTAAGSGFQTASGFKRPNFGDISPLVGDSGFQTVSFKRPKHPQHCSTPKEAAKEASKDDLCEDDRTLLENLPFDCDSFTQDWIESKEKSEITALLDKTDLPEGVQQGREAAIKLQLNQIADKVIKPDESFISDFVEKKLKPKRPNLRQFVNKGLPRKYSKEDLLNSGVKPSTITLNWDNSLNFEFDLCDFFEETEVKTNISGLNFDHFTVIPNMRNKVGFPEISRAFQASTGINFKSIPDGWLENSWSLITIKLSSTEMSFPHQFGGQLMTPGSVLNQLSYRYYREIASGEKPAIRQITELEESPQKTLVLFVAEIRDENTVFLSDGWYRIPGKLDAALAERVKKGMITVGTKVITQGSALVNLNMGCSPLNLGADAAMELHGNATRRCKWETKLGFYAQFRPHCVTLDDVLYNGGLIPGIMVSVIRVYPPVYLEEERFRRGNQPIVRSERAEKLHCSRLSGKSFENFERVYNGAYEEIMLQQSQQVNGAIRNITNIQSIRDPEVLSAILKKSYDPESVEHEMSMSQKNMVQEHLREKLAKKFQEVDECVRRRLRFQRMERKVKKLQKIRVVDALKPQKTAIIQFWNPPEDFTSILNEEDCYEMMNCSAKEILHNDIYIDGPSFGDEEQDQLIRKLDRGLFRIPDSFLRRITPFTEIPRIPPDLREFDVVGVVVKIEKMPNNRIVEQVILADAQMNLLKVNFWYGLEHFAFDNIVRLKAILCFSNLQWRPFSSIHPLLTASELTVITENPKSKMNQKALDDLRTTLSKCNLDYFIRECEKKLSRSLILSPSIECSICLHTDILTPHARIMSPILQGSWSGKLMEARSLGAADKVRRFIVTPSVAFKAARERTTSQELMVVFPILNKFECDPERFWR
ncbi:hypothetical protein DMENIID0001_148880 [Sergentomyia squamirostris]